MLHNLPQAVHAAAERRTASDRRPAIWPWLLMPLAVLAMFFALRSVRHSTDGSPFGQGGEISGDASAQ